MTKEDLDNRFSHHPPSAAQVEKYARIRSEFRAVAQTIFELCPPGREKATAVTKLEEAMFFANAAIARHQPET